MSRLNSSDDFEVFLDDFGIDDPVEESLDNKEVSSPDVVVSGASKLLGKKLSAWQVGLLLGVCCILLVLLLVFGRGLIKSFSLYRADDKGGVTEVTSGAVSLLEVPKGTSIVYKNILDVDGMVEGKHLYLDAATGQVLYALDLGVSLGSNGVLFRYFCSKSIYDSVDVGLGVRIKYHQMEGGYFSIDSVSLRSEK